MTARTYTFLFTDIQGSTRYWEQQPEAMRAALERHNSILRTAIESNGGWVFRTAGDAFHASFNTAAAGLAAAVAAQRELYAQAWELDSPLQVRMALHSGEAEEQAGDYVGASLNRIGRLIGLCHGGQTLLTQATQELVRDSLPEGVSLRDLGRHRFRDLVYPERIYQAVIAGLPADFPPLKSLESIPNNLPAQVTSFIGRERELAAAAEGLAQARLLTLTGPGGAGKTRLALQVASGRLADYPDGAWLVELAPVSDPRLVLPGVAGVLNVREHPGQSLLEALIEALRSQRLLLVLDNCEHLVAACAQLCTELLRACPEVKILASSREVLGISGEMTLNVPPLSLPDLNGRVDLDALQRSEAVQLFVERARAVQPAFDLNNLNAAAVAQICRRLDGIPLAIELAAARVRLLKPEQIASRLDDLFHLLTGGSRTALPRQQTLEALIGWSYDLLSPAERVLFRRLAVFSGGWTLEAAEAVCSGEAENLSLRPEMGLDLLAQLVNKSLVAVEDGEGEARFRLLETIRQYAHKELVAAGEVDGLRDRHLAYFKQFSDQAAAGLQGPDQPTWLGRLERDHDNLRLALDWGLEHDPLAALALANNLTYFWSGRGYGSEGRRWLQAGLDRLETMRAAGTDQRDAGQEDAGPAGTGLAGRTFQARALSAYGQIAITQGDYAAARQALEQSVQMQREAADLQALVVSLALLSLATLFSGEIDHSQALAEEGERLGRQLQEPIGLALSLSILAQIDMRGMNGYLAAREKMEESARLLRSYGNRWFAGLSLLGLGIIAHLAQDLDTAERHFQESERIFQEAGDWHFSTTAHGYLADVKRGRGDYPGATHLYQETLENWLRMGHRGGIARGLECLGFIAAEQALSGPPEDRPAGLERAGTFLGTAEAIREAAQAGMTIDEQLDYWGQTSGLRGRLASDPDSLAAFEAAWQAGRVADKEAVLGLALA